MLLNAAFLGQLGEVFMEKNAGKDLRYGALFLDLETPEPGAGIQRPGIYCRKVSR